MADTGLEPPRWERAASTGGRTLEVFAGTPRINAWMYGHFADRVRGRVLEVGSGIGNLSRLLVRHASHAVLTDVDDAHLEVLRRDLGDHERVTVLPFDLAQDPSDGVLAQAPYDAVLAVNVIEHVEDDASAVARLASLLRPDGHLLAYVPACPWAFGTLDEALGHYRRYTPRSFGALLEGAGLALDGAPRYVNLLGLPGWWLNGRLLRRRRLDAAQVAVFERLVPVLGLERFWSPPVGLGVVAIARRHTGAA